MACLYFLLVVTIALYNYRLRFAAKRESNKDNAESRSWNEEEKKVVRSSSVVFREDRGTVDTLVASGGGVKNIVGDNRV